MVDPAALMPVQTPELADQQAKAKLGAKARQIIAEINAAEKSQADYLTRARKIVSRYKKEGSTTSKRRQFAMLWSNTETVRPAIYSRPPEPVITRRFGDADPVGRVTSEVWERALKYSSQPLDVTLATVSLDYVLIARGQTWERYVPTFGPQVIPEIALQIAPDSSSDDDSEDEPQYLDPDGNPVDPNMVQVGAAGPFMAGDPYRPVEYEESVTDYVNYEDFGHNVARTWAEVDLVYRRSYMGRDALIDRFGKEIGGAVSLDWGRRESTGRFAQDSTAKKAAIYEVWIKSEKKVYWISKGYSDSPLDVRDDPLKLDGFFPCPKPLLGTTANDSLIPTPDFVFYQDQAEEIDDLTDKISELQKALKVVGLYAGDKASTVGTLVAKSNNTLIPVPDWLGLKEAGGIRGAVEWWPIDMVVQALEAMIAQRQQLMNDIYQVTGIGDVLRGMNDPRATATAEAIKGQWGTLRIRARQKEMQRFARDAIAIKAEVIAGKFDLQTLKTMTQLELPMQADKDAIVQQLQQQAMQQQLMAQQQAAQAQAQQMQGPKPGGPMMGAQPQQPPPQAAPPPPPPQPTPEQAKILASPTWEDVMGRLRDNAVRCFSIDIETDSTIEANEQEERGQATELLQALGQMVAQLGPAVQAQPALAPMVGEIIKWSMRKFRAGRQIEDVIDRSMDQMVQAAGNAPPPGQADPGAADAAAKQQTAVLKQQSDMAKIQSDQQIAQGDQAIEAQKVQIQAAELQLAQGEQTIKAMALQRDPNPQSVN